MPKFIYEARNVQGVKIKGELEASTQQEAKSRIEDMGLMLSSLKIAGAASSKINNVFAKKVHPPELIMFTKQFRSLFKAGVPITQLLNIMQSQAENASLKQACAEMSQYITTGGTLSSSFRQHPKIFNQLYCSMIEAGELSGSLDIVLDRLIYLIQHEYKISSDLKSATRYPKMVVIALSIAFVVLLNGVIPTFVGIFEAAKLDLPAPTVAAIALQRFMEKYWYICIGIVVIGVFAYKQWIKSPDAQCTRDGLLLRLPLVGPVMLKSAMARFAAIFAILQTSGVSTLAAFDVLINTIGNSAIAREFARIQDKLKEGKGIANPLRTARYFTPLVVSMVAIGEESGNLDTMLGDIASHYDEEVEYAVASMAEAIGPLLIVGLTVVVGFFALAIFLPMWSMTDMVKG